MLQANVSSLDFIMLNSEPNDEECDPPSLRYGRAGATEADSSTDDDYITKTQALIELQIGKVFTN